MILSPSFYQSSCLVQLTSHTSDPDDLLRLISQFNSFPSWVQLPDHHQLCQDHLVNSNNKIEFLLFAKKQLELENKPGAIATLESCKNFKWPEVYRSV